MGEVRACCESWGGLFWRRITILGGYSIRNQFAVYIDGPQRTQLILQRIARVVMLLFLLFHLPYDNRSMLSYMQSATATLILSEHCTTNNRDTSTVLTCYEIRAVCKIIFPRALASSVPSTNLVHQAKRRCPSLVVMDGEDLTRYREASEAIFRSVCFPRNVVMRFGRLKYRKARDHLCGDGKHKARKMEAICSIAFIGADLSEALPRSGFSSS